MESEFALRPFPDHVGSRRVWRWCLTAPLVWEVGYRGSGLVVTVPDGFVTDLASIPAWARWLLSPHDPETAKAAVIHDWMTPTIEDVESGRHPRPLWDCRTAAGEFYAVLKAEQVPLWRRLIYYLAVVIGIGRGNW